jgi:hypothetical protein
MVPTVRAADHQGWPHSPDVLRQTMQCAGGLEARERAPQSAADRAPWKESLTTMARKAGRLERTESHLRDYAEKEGSARIGSLITYRAVLRKDCRAGQAGIVACRALGSPYLRGVYKIAKGPTTA